MIMIQNIWLKMTQIIKNKNEIEKSIIVLDIIEAIEQFLTVQKKD